MKGYKNICYCNHNKSDHAHVARDNRHGGKCEWFDCNCQKFRLKEITPNQTKGAFWPQNQIPDYEVSK